MRERQKEHEVTITANGEALTSIIGEARHETEYGHVTRITAEDVTNDSMVAMAKDLAARMQMMHWERQYGNAAMRTDAGRDKRKQQHGGKHE